MVDENNRKAINLALLARPASVPGLQAGAKAALHGMEETLLKLESRTDRLRSTMLAMPASAAPQAKP